MTSNKSQLKEINKIAQRYIILASPSKKIAEELLEWWNE